MVRHHDHRRGVEAVDEHPHLLVDVHRHRAAERLEALRAVPLRGLGEEGVGDLLVVDRVEEAEEPRLVLVPLEVELVELRRDPADGPAVLVGDEGGALGVLVEGCLLYTSRCV